MTDAKGATAPDLLSHSDDAESARRVMLREYRQHAEHAMRQYDIARLEGDVQKALDQSVEAVTLLYRYVVLRESGDG